MVGSAVITVKIFDPNVTTPAPFNCTRDEAGLGQCVPLDEGEKGQFDSYKGCSEACTSGSQK